MFFLSSCGATIKRGLKQLLCWLHTNAISVCNTYFLISMKVANIPANIIKKKEFIKQKGSK